MPSSRPRNTDIVASRRLSGPGHPGISDAEWPDPPIPLRIIATRGACRRRETEKGLHEGVATAPTQGRGSHREEAHQRRRVRGRRRADRDGGGTPVAPGRRGEPDRAAAPTRPAPRQGRPDLRRRLRARAAARRLRRVRHARRGLPRGDLHLARARPDARGHHGGARRRRGAAHREELHRRRAQLRDGRRARRRGGHRGGEPCWSTTTWRCRTPSTPPGGAAPAPRCSSRRSPARSPRPARRSPRSRESAEEVNARSRSFGIALTSCTTPAAGKPTFDLGDDRGRAGHRHPRRAGPDPRRPMRPARELARIAMDAIHEDLPLSGDTARHGERHGRHAR